MRRRIHAYMEDTCIYIHVSIQRLYDTCRERERIYTRALTFKNLLNLLNLCLLQRALNS